MIAARALLCSGSSRCAPCIECVVDLGPELVIERKAMLHEGYNKGRRIRLPADQMVICSNSTLPDGWVVVATVSTTVCTTSGFSTGRRIIHL